MTGNGYVIMRDDGKYVTKPGSAHSYTKLLQEARVFSTQGEADRECCGNERVLPLMEAFTTGGV